MVSNSIEQQLVHCAGFAFFSRSNPSFVLYSICLTHVTVPSAPAGPGDGILIVGVDDDDDDGGDKADAGEVACLRRS